MSGQFKVLFFVEGFTDIRFIVGFSEICKLTIAVPARQYASSGLKDRVAQSGADVQVHEISGGRLGFQAKSFAWLWRHAREFDVIVSQEVLRGSLNATVVGRLRRVPVITYMGIAPIEYFRCRRARGQIGPVKAWLGENVIRLLMTVNGRLATRCLAMGPYLADVASRYCPRTSVGLYYGVDTDYFRPASSDERATLRRKLNLPLDKFIVLLSSRISHEKDPETVIDAVAKARSRGLDSVLLNLGGGFREFLALARSRNVPAADDWVLGRPAAHPMNELADYFRSVDAVALASLAEGAAYSTLEALACATPVVATNVGGMAAQLSGYARLVPSRNPQAMADELLWIAEHEEESRAQALKGRNYVIAEWNRDRAFQELAMAIASAAQLNHCGSK